MKIIKHFILIINLLNLNYVFCMDPAEEKLNYVLWDATKKNDFGKIKQLINSGANILAQDNEGKTALDMAKEKNNPEILNLFKEKLSYELWGAARKNDFEKIKQLLNLGADINHQNYDGCTILDDLVSRSENENMIAFLLELGAKPNINHKYDRPQPLMIAVAWGYKDIVNLLIKFGAEVNKISKISGRTPLFNAVYHKNHEIVEILLNSGANILAQDNDGKTALDLAKEKNSPEIIKLLNDRYNNLKSNLFNAINNGDYETIKKLLKHISLGVYDPNGNNPLHYAIFAKETQNKLKIFELIFSCRPQLLIKENNSKQTPLYYIHNYPIILKSLFIVNNKKNFEIKSDNDIPTNPRLIKLLICAINNNNLDEIKKLIKSGISINQKDDKGYMSLMYAANMLDTEIINFLLENGSDPNINDNYGTNSCIHLVSRQKYKWADEKIKEVLKQFISKGANIYNKTKEKGYNVFMFSVAYGYLETVKLLLNYNFDINERDFEEFTPLHLAIVNSQPEIVKLLLESGANINLKDYRNRSVLLMAANNCDEYDIEKIIKMLIDKGAKLNSDEYKEFERVLKERFSGSHFDDDMKCPVNYGNFYLTILKILKK